MSLPDLSNIQIAGRWITWVPPYRGNPVAFDANVRQIPEQLEALRELIDRLGSPPVPKEEAGSADLEAAARIAVDRDPRLDWGLLEEMHADDWGPHPAPPPARGDKT